MSSKHKKLGSLADIYQSENLDGAITTIQTERLYPSADQPRTDRQVSVGDLASSIKNDGLLSPIIVTKEGDKYRIIAGERRYHAIKSLGWKEVECRIISREDRDYYRIAIIENLQREDLPAHDEAAALFRLKKQENYSDQDLANIVGKSRNYITEILGIALLPDDILNKCKQAGVENKNMMIQAVQAFKKGKFDSFLEALNSGAIRTVKSAKEFINSSPAQLSDPDNKKPHKAQESQDHFEIKKRGAKLTITCPDPEQARKLESWIQSKYPHWKNA